jgi:hypothetical protein
MMRWAERSNIGGREINSTSTALSRAIGIPLIARESGIPHLDGTARGWARVQRDWQECSDKASEGGERLAEPFSKKRKQRIISVDIF